MMQSGTDAIRDADFSITYNKTGSKEIDKLVNIYNEMIVRLREERTSMSQQSYFVQKLIEVTPLGVIIMDYDGLVSNMNPSSKSILRIKHSLIGNNLYDNQNDLIDELKNLEVGQSQMITINGLDKYKCQKNEVIHQGFKRQFILIDDLSRELLASEKEAYGKIIRMMAHEVNNSMGAINSILDSVIEFGFKNHPDQELKESLLIAKNRNESLSQFMANYASILRLPKPNLILVDIALILKRSTQLFIPSAEEKKIKIKFDIPIIQLSIKADRLLLEQAFANILKNAIESVEEKMVRSKLDNEKIMAGEINVSLDPENYTIHIMDNGVGIKKEDEHQIFSPFYSTKPTGQGVGLMLIREILDAHGFDFSLKTNPQTQLTSFLINLQPVKI